jgi:predicted small secreted protein
MTGLEDRQLLWHAIGGTGRRDEEPRGDEMKTSLAICAFVILVAGCVADTMRGYVGQDIRAVVLAYGPPANEIDLGGGTRAFQWSKVSVDTTPVSAVTTTEKDRKGRRSTQTQFVGGTQTVTNCLYTFLAAWDPRRDGWIVTGFRQPSLDCAIGGLG